MYREKWVYVYTYVDSMMQNTRHLPLPSEPDSYTSNTAPTRKIYHRAPLIWP